MLFITSWRQPVSRKIHTFFLLKVLTLTFVLFPSSITGQINFNGYTIDDSIHGTGGLYASDLDNDNDMDVLAASLQDNNIVWWRNDGGSPIAWTKYIIGENVGGAHSVYTADFDNDGDQDVVGAAYYGTPGIAWWRNDGGNPITWTKFPVGEDFINAHLVYVHDLDLDGDPDVLGASSDLNEIAWWRNDGGNPIVWTKQVISAGTHLAKSVHAGDLDGDGDVDVLGTAILANDILWWRNDGGQPIQWTQFTLDGNFVGAHWAQAVDLDNDGDQDVLGAGYLGHEIAWWSNDGGNPPQWTKQTIGMFFSHACVALAADLDNDGDRDVVATAQGRNQIAWWRNDGGDPFQWTKFVITNNFVRPWPLYVTDLDGDADMDIIAGSSHDGSNIVGWWENAGFLGIDTGANYPHEFKLQQNFPNPFNPVTTISYYLPNSVEVVLTIYNVSGQKIKILVNETQSPGRKTAVWDGIDESGNTVGSGVYFYNIQTGDGNQVSLSKKMLYLK